ncbi:MAG: MFS transporter [Planctomycetes bacterium]|nr:MFS transporter [Planctomycetota bacterium]
MATAIERPWYKELTGYHWFVFVVAALGWLFDCLDQQLFVLARPAAMAELVTGIDDPKLLEIARRDAGNWATSLFLIGWASGGLFFGVLGDRIGRAKTMMWTIILYSLFTGLNSFATGPWTFSLFRFLTGLGVGGEFAVGVALIAEVMPARARPYTLGLLQALSALGNVSAALINMGLGVAEEEGLVTSPWRIMFLVGAVPALLALVIRSKLKEPEQWQKASHDQAVAKQLGSYSELFTNPRWRKNAIIGLLLACSGVIGLWAVGFFAPDLTRYVQRKRVATEVYTELAAKADAGDKKDVAAKYRQLIDLERAAATSGYQVPEELKAARNDAEPIVQGRLSRWASYTSIMINIGAFCGMFGFTALSQKIGRKPTFALALVAAFVSTASVFWFLSEFWQIFVLVPIMGFCQLSLFGGYAVYFPELFPTRLRSTGTSFCYNVGRFVAAGGPLVKSQLESAFRDTPEPLRYAGVAMCAVFLIGLFVLPFAPETKGQPLPE